TFTGRSPAEVGRTLRALGVQALGANCSVGSSTLYGVLEQMVPAAGSLPLAIQPNAGLPSRVGERLIYLSSPAYMAEYAARMVDAGARVVGGCCGTTPQHIAAMRETLDRKRPPRRDAVRPTVTVTTPAVGTNLHFPCRDRNLMGIQADLLGAPALDVRNILALKGDPPRAGDYVNTTAVFDVNAIGLIEVLKRMNQGLDATGNSIGTPTSFCVGAALNPGAENIKAEISRFQRKVHAGAQWLQTQPVYDLAELDRFLEQAGGPPVPVIVGVLPLHSYRHAEFLHNEVPGITIPEQIRARLRDAGDGALRVGIEMAQRLVREIRSRYAGVYLMPSFGRFEVVAEVLDALH